MSSLATGPDCADPTAIRLANLVRLCLFLNLVALVVAPILRPDVSLLRASLSHYAVGPHAWLQTAAFVAFGIGCLALGIAVPRALTGSRAALAAGVLLALAGLGAFGLAIMPMGVPQPMTPIGDIHATAGTIAVVAQFGAIALLLRAIRDRPSWQSLRPLGIGLGLLALAAAAVHQVAMWYPALSIPEGITIRVVAVTTLVWWWAVALRIAAPERVPSSLRRSSAGR